MKTGENTSITPARPGSTLVRTEIANLSRLATPIIITQLAQMGMGVTDAIMAGHVSAKDLAGVALGGNLFWPVMFFLSGVIMSVTPSVSQLNGAGQSEKVGPMVRQAFWIVIIGGMMAFALLQNMEPVYYFVGVDPVAIPIAVAYLDAVSWGLFPILGYFVMRYVCDGMSWTRPAMIIALTALAIKIPVNYLFIYGGLGIEAMGGVGCGVASAIVMSMEFLAMVLMLGFGRLRHLEVLAHFCWPDWREIRRLIRLGFPIGVTVFVEMAVFSAVSLMIGRLGVESLASHQIAMNVGGMTFMVPLAIGMAATIRVGYNVGARDYLKARISGLVALGTSLVLGVITVTLVFAFRSEIARLFTTDPRVISIATALVTFVCFFQISDNLQVTAVGVLRGYKDTKAPMYIGLFAYWVVAFPAGAALTFGVDMFGISTPGMGVEGFWWALVVGLGIAAVILLGRFLRLSKDTNRIQSLAVL